MGDEDEKKARLCRFAREEGAAIELRLEALFGRSVTFCLLLCDTAALPDFEVVSEMNMTNYAFRECAQALFRGEPSPRG